MGRLDTDAAAARNRPRFKLFQPATMVIDGRLTRVHLLDLSASGALIHHAAPPPAGIVVKLECAGRMRMARIVWSQGTRFGISFALPLSDHQVTDALAHQRAMVAAHASRLGAVA